MAKAPAQKRIQCYHCRAPFEVSTRAMTVACAKCGKRVIVHDVKIKDAQGVTKLQTCGKITIEKRGTVIAQLVEAHEGIEVLGTLDSKKIFVRGPMKLGPKSTLRGDLRAEAIEINPGAKVRGGSFQIATELEGAQKGLADLPGLSSDQQQPATKTLSTVTSKHSVRTATANIPSTKKKIVRKKISLKKIATKANTQA